MRCLAAWLLACALVAATLQAQADDDPWLGQLVLLKETARPRLGKQSFTWNEMPLPAKVTEVNGDWLWLGKAWVTKSEALRIDDAPDYFTGLIRRQPTNVVGYALRGLAWQLNGEYRNSLKDFEEANRLQPNNSSFITLRGKAYYLLHRYDDALNDFTEAIRLEPSNLVAYNDRGATYNAMGEFERAVDQFNQVLKKDANNALALSNRGVNRSEQGDLEGALSDLDRAIKLQPDMAESYCNRGRVLTKWGDYPDALDDFDKALELAPGNWVGYYGYAYIRATAPQPQLRDGQRAKTMATKACELSHWNEWLAISALAAACAEVGDFDAAVRWQSKAIELTPAGKDKHRRDGQERLALYKDGKPFYEKEVPLRERPADPEAKKLSDDARPAENKASDDAPKPRGL